MAEPNITVYIADVPEVQAALNDLRAKLAEATSIMQEIIDNRGCHDPDCCDEAFAHQAAIDKAKAFLASDPEPETRT